MKTKLLLGVMLCFMFSISSLAQKLTIGVENGINFSNVHKKNDYDRFKAKTGPVNGIFAKYDLGNWFVLQTGITRIGLNHEERSYTYYDPWYWNKPYDLASSCWMPPRGSYYETSTLNFLRVPLLVKFKTPGRLNFEIGGGYYYAFMTNDEFRGKEKERFDKEYRDENFPDLTDWGLILASSVNYNISERWHIFASGQIVYGKEKYHDNVDGKLGSTELTFGVGYKTFAKKQGLEMPDSLGKRLTLLPYSGILISQTKATENGGKYKTVVNFTSGVSLKYKLDKTVSMLTGAWYERKGYHLAYEGVNTSIYKLDENNNIHHNSEITSHVNLDYITIPLLFDFTFGKKFKSAIKFGAYYSLLQNAFVKGEILVTQKHTTGYMLKEEFFDDSCDELFRSYDAGVIAGYRLEYPLFRWGNIFAAANQSFGAVNILEDHEKTNLDRSLKVKNRSTSFVLGLTIPVNKN